MKQEMLYRERRVGKKLSEIRGQEKGVGPWQVACGSRHCCQSCVAGDQCCYTLAVELFAWMLWEQG